MKRKTKQTLKTILLGALGIGAIVGVASGVNALVDKDGTELKTIHPTFEIGGLNADGEHEESDKTIYTKTAFECQGLEIKLDFENEKQIDDVFKNAKKLKKEIIKDNEYMDEDIANMLGVMISTYIIVGQFEIIETFFLEGFVVLEPFGAKIKLFEDAKIIKKYIIKTYDKN